MRITASPLAPQADQTGDCKVDLCAKSEPFRRTEQRLCPHCPYVGQGCLGSAAVIALCRGAGVCAWNGSTQSACRAVFLSGSAQRIFNRERYTSLVIRLPWLGKRQLGAGHNRNGSAGSLTKIAGPFSLPRRR